jgi:tripartite-type tricarboxylate transporter receptor subunit TctC
MQRPEEKGIRRGSSRPRRSALAPVIAWLLYGALMPRAHAADGDYPTHPIRFIVPSAPGGAPDTSSRLLATELTAFFGKQVVVDNRPGASGVIGTDLTAKATPDGYTIGQGNILTLAINRSLIKKLPYDIDKDLQKVVQLSFVTNLLAVTPQLQVGNVKELISYARANPGKLLYGSGGAGTTHHLGVALLAHMTGTKMVHVPYKSTQQAITEMIAGQIQVMADGTASILPHVRAGRVRGLATTGPKRSVAAPDLPTVSEAGVPGYEVISWNGIVVPAGVSPAIVRTLNSAVNKVIASQDFRDRIAKIGYETAGGTPKQFAELIARDTRKWAEIVRISGATAE